MIREFLNQFVYTNSRICALHAFRKAGFNVVKTD